MKEWAYTLILCSLLTLCSKVLLPKGERSPLFSPIKFLISLIFIIATLSPLVAFFKSDPQSGKTNWGFWEESRTEMPVEQIILEKSAKRMEQSVHSAFPEAEFSLRIEADENFVPTGIRVFCDKRETGLQISLFLQENYGILTTYEEKELT